MTEAHPHWLTVKGHPQPITHHYVMHYPDHAPRKDDPHYKDFEAYHRKTKPTAKCEVGAKRNDFTECAGELELHHSHVEFALANGVDLKWLEVDYPGISNPDEVGAWVETAANLEWLCEFHHRGHGGVHVASASDFTAEEYVRGLIT
jgi:hypothetical protein